MARDNPGRLRLLRERARDDEAIEEMNEAALFVSPAHLRVLSEWTSHPRAGVSFRMAPNPKHEGAYEFRLGSENVLILARTIQTPSLPMEDLC